MGRGRSPSPTGPRRGTDRERRRSRSRDRERRQRRRSRSRSPYRKRSRSPRRRSNSRERDDNQSSIPKPFKVSKPKVDEEELKNMDPEDADMMRVMGFSGFETTKGKPVEGNDAGTSNIILKRKFRQYMNRRGGFNRPLDFIA